jgi:hypothetical protein
MRDPLDAREGPYAVLGIGRDAKLPEIQAAYQRRTRERAGRTKKPTEALNRLRRAELRFEEDFWYYPSSPAIETPASTADVVAGPVQLEVISPVVDVSPGPSALAEASGRRDRTAPRSKTPAVSHLERYDDDPVAALTRVRLSKVPNARS